MPAFYYQSRGSTMKRRKRNDILEKEKGGVIV
ncbi:hypothetical protein FHS14_004422 [Paenibacillus baekrokdamisoli]|nr:hypothetical protein [Paenibacillus baekrokdamisoli]